MEVASHGVANGIATSTQASLVDTNAVIHFLVEVLQATLGALKIELEGAGSLLSQEKHEETVQRCTRFASEPQVALYVQKDIVGSEVTNGAGDGDGRCTLMVRCRKIMDSDINQSQHHRPSMSITFPPKFPRPLPRSQRLPSSNARPLSILRFRSPLRSR